MALAPKDLCIAELEISDTMAVEQIDITQLPDGWDEHPAPLTLSMMGEAWLKGAQSAVLKVPSAVVKDEWNLLINPLHADFSHIAILSVESYQFDKRLLR
jgi:RES domain-containing protein